MREDISCCVIGMGFLGTRIAGELSRHGVKVKVFDVSSQQLEKAMNMLEKDSDELLKRGLSPLDKNNILLSGNLVDAVEHSDIIFEAVSDDLHVKKSTYQKVTNICKSDAIICSNSINLNLDEIGEDSLFKDRIIGCRFLVPVYSIPLVEISLSTYSAENAQQRVEKFFQQLGYSTIYKRHGLMPRKLTPNEIDQFWSDERRKLQSSTRNPIAQESSDIAHEHYKSGLIFSNDNWGHGRASPIPSGHSASGHSANIARREPAENLYVSLGAAQSSAATETVQNLASQHNDETMAGHVTMVDRSGVQGGDSFKECVICQDRAIDTIIFPCSHMWLCHPCALSLKQSENNCPACRGAISYITKAYTP